jgi:REP element-mobilizing transposase RayT
MSKVIRSELYAYISALVMEKGAKLLIINGVADHVHLLVVLPPNLHVSDLLKFVKANSSRWIKQRFRKPFAWQKGFGAFSVSRSNVAAVARYIREQEMHHQKLDYRAEYLALLRKNEVDFDEEYLWK